MSSTSFAAFPELSRIGLALALGLLVGVQRGWAKRGEADGTRFAGIRTFGLLGLAGGIAGALQARASGLATVLLAATAALLVLGYWRSTSSKGPVSGTTSLVGLLTLACGYLAGSGEVVLAAAISGVMVLVLAMRKQFHGWVATLDEREIMAIARFAIIALVILPLLPDTPFGPYGAWRARQLWLVVVLVSGFSFAGYLAAKYFGATRGVLATAAAGSMVSSTAVTASLAGKLKSGDGDARILNAGIALASAVMFLRVMALSFVLAPLALPTLAMIAAPGLVISLGAALALAHRTGAERATPSAAMPLRNPFDLGPALLLAALTMVLMLVARWVLARYGNSGLATVLAISGVVDVDSAIITMGNLPAGTLSPRLAGLVLAPPIVLNTLLKAGMAASMSGGRSGWPGAATLVVSALASGTVAVLLL